jgi:hypothetical protein
MCAILKMVDTGSPELLHKKNSGCARLKHFKVKEMIYKFLYFFYRTQIHSCNGKSIIHFSSSLYVNISYIMYLQVSVCVSFLKEYNRGLRRGMMPKTETIVKKFKTICFHIHTIQLSLIVFLKTGCGMCFKYNLFYNCDVKKPHIM